jgi:hypothetical protein
MPVSTISSPAALTIPGSVLQVQSTTLTSTFSASVNQGASSGDAIAVSITPKFSTSKILISFNGVLGESNDTGVFAILYKNGSAVAGATGDAAGNRQRVSASAAVALNTAFSVGVNYLDSPATTSSTTYSIRLSTASGEARTVYLNQSGDDVNQTYGFRAASTIMVMEIAA